MENTSVNENTRLSAADWHMKFLKSWRFIVVVICFALTAPIALLTFQVGTAALELSDYMREPLAIAEHETEQARLYAITVKNDPASDKEARQASYMEYQHKLGYSRKLWFSWLSNFIAGLTITVGAVCTLLLIPLALLTPVNVKISTITMQGIFVLLKVKVYVLYLLIAGVVMGMPGFGSAMDLLAQSIGAQSFGDMSGVLFIVAPVLVFYLLVLRNVSIIATDVAKALRTNKFPGAFGLSCGLTWQGILMMSFSLFALLVLLIVVLIASLTVPGSVRELLGAVARVLPAFNGGWWTLVGCLLWLAFSAVKFGTIAWCYPHYIRLSQEMKGCAADVLIENTAPGATPVPYRRY